MNFAAVDIGNSRIKLIVNGLVFAYKYQKDYISQVLNHFTDVSAVAVSSVNPYIYDKLISAMDKSGINYYSAESLIENCSFIDFSNVQGMGIDRKLGLAGASIFAPNPYITVDCGTAVTVNSVDENGKCNGGVIFPGLYTQLKALNTFTGSLPLVDFTSVAFPPANNTNDAVRAGVLSSVIGGIEHSVDSILKILPKNSTSIFITGGYSDFLINYLKYDDLQLEKDLVLLGLKHLIELYH